LFGIEEVAVLVSIFYFFFAGKDAVAWCERWFGRWGHHGWCFGDAFTWLFDEGLLGVFDGCFGGFGGD
jgi:hypothetical protein